MRSLIAGMRRPKSALLLLGIAAAAVMATFVGPAQAQGYRRPGYYHGWNGGYYRSPPIVYGSPYRGRYYAAPRYYPPRYYPPPVVYGPGLNFNLRIR
jgi:hypothetical protein